MVEWGFTVVLGGDYTSLFYLPTKWFCGDSPIVGTYSGCVVFNIGGNPY